MSNGVNVMDGKSNEKIKEIKTQIKVAKRKNREGRKIFYFFYKHSDEELLKIYDGDRYTLSDDMFDVALFACHENLAPISHITEVLARAANLDNHIDAMYLLVDIYNNEHKYEEAIYWYKRGIELKDVDCMINLGKMYLQGDGVEKNYSEAVKYFKMGADLYGERPWAGQAMQELARCYIKGYGVPANEEIALEYYHKSDSDYQNDKESYDSIFFLEIANDYSEIKNYKKAFEYFTKVANIDKCIHYQEESFKKLKLYRQLTYILREELNKNELYKQIKDELSYDDLNDETKKVIEDIHNGKGLGKIYPSLDEFLNDMGADWFEKESEN